MKAMVLIIAAALGLASAASGQGTPRPPEPVTFESLLREMVDREAPARFPDPAYTCRQFSSYDPASKTPDDPAAWFANGDAGHFVREEDHGGRHEFVLMDAPGPGAVVRIWSANPAGTLRVYLDGADTPAIEAPMTDILGGKWIVPPPLSEQTSRGWNLYLPIPYAKRCVITSDQGGFYYHVNYRTYAKGADVESLNAQALHRIKSSTPEPIKELHRPAMPTYSFGDLRTLRPGETADFRITDAEGPGSIRGIAMALLPEGKPTGPRDPAWEQALRSTVLALEFDGEETVWCPISDFFGSGVGMTLYTERLRTIHEDGTFTCGWVMPFRASAKARVINTGGVPVRFAFSAQTGPWLWDKRSMHFYARWHHDYPCHVLGGRGTRDWNFIDIEGKGVLVGDNLSVMNPVADWWGEGDEKIYVDGERGGFPSHFGTGTEDYYGYAWCSNQLFRSPFHGQVRCDGAEHGNNWGFTSVTRLRFLDAIPFTSSLKFDMEQWHWKECDVAYAATTYFYALPAEPPMPGGRPAPRHNRPADVAAAAAPIPRPPALPPPFAIEGAIEIESLPVAAKSEGLNTVIQDMRGFAAGRWSGEKQLWVQARKAGDFVEIDLRPLGPGGPQSITLYATKSWDYGIVRFSINGKPAECGDVDLYSGAHGRCEPAEIHLGFFTPEKTESGPRLRLRAEVVGKNPASEGTASFFGLDAVKIEGAE
jgi:hypothetical protein